MPKSKKNIDELVKQALQEYHQAHTTKVERKYGNTYVTVYREDVYDKMQILFDLMRIQYSVDLSKWFSDEKIIFIITGDDEKCAAFIQQFVDNKYRLIWE
jgi:hypothetical protein